MIVFKFAYMEESGVYKPLMPSRNGFLFWTIDGSLYVHEQSAILEALSGCSP